LDLEAFFATALGAIAFLELCFLLTVTLPVALVAVFFGVAFFFAGVFVVTPLTAEADGFAFFDVVPTVVEATPPVFVFFTPFAVVFFGVDLDLPPPKARDQLSE
jgi:hypothetical protein